MDKNKLFGRTVLINRHYRRGYARVSRGPARYGVCTWEVTNVNPHLAVVVGWRTIYTGRRFPPSYGYDGEYEPGYRRCDFTHTALLVVDHPRHAPYYVPVWAVLEGGE